jgi:hypothetical protein
MLVKSSLLTCDREPLRKWLDGAITRISTGIFTPTFNAEVLLDESYRAAIFKQIDVFRASKTERAEMLMGIDDKKVITSTKHECAVILYAASVAILFIRDYPVVRRSQYININEFLREFANSSIYENGGTVLGTNCSPAEKDSIRDYSNFVKIATLCIPTRAKKGKLRDVAASLAGEVKYSRGGSSKAYGFLRQNKILEVIAASRGEVIAPLLPSSKRKNGTVVRVPRFMRRPAHCHLTLSRQQTRILR